MADTTERVDTQASVPGLLGFSGGSVEEAAEWIAAGIERGSCSAAKRIVRNRAITILTALELPREAIVTIPFLGKVR